MSQLVRFAQNTNLQHVCHSLCGIFMCLSFPLLYIDRHLRFYCAQNQRFQNKTWFIIYFSRKEIDQAAMIVFTLWVCTLCMGHIMYLKSLALNRCSSTVLSSFASLEYFLFFLLFLLCLLEMLGSHKIFGFLEVLRLLVYDALHIYLDCRGQSNGFSQTLPTCPFSFGQSTAVKHRC